MKSNLFENLPETLLEEFFETILDGKSFRVERIVSSGHSSPDDFWYDQSQPEWVLLISGSATLELETADGIEVAELQPGDHILIPGHQRHRVVRTSADPKTVWLAIHFDSQDCR